MHTNITPVFSSFRKLKHTNPETVLLSTNSQRNDLSAKEAGFSFLRSKQEGIMHECIPTIRTR
jgi:hypothetical protein